jgi:activator of HSP90 ATPase
MSKPAKMKTAKVSLVEGFDCRPKDIFEAFTDAKLISTYTRSPAIIEKLEVGQKFSFFGGDLTGQYKSIEFPNRLVTTFRFKEWPDECESIVTYTFKGKYNNFQLTCN